MDTVASDKPATGIDTSGFKLLHTMIRVLDLDKSIDFYCRLLGMKLLRKRPVEAGRYTNAFVGYEDDATGTVLELTYNWDQKEPYTPLARASAISPSASRTSTPPARRSKKKA